MLLKQQYHQNKRKKVSPFHLPEKAQFTKAASRCHREIQGPPCLPCTSMLHLPILCGKVNGLSPVTNQDEIPTDTT